MIFIQEQIKVFINFLNEKLKSSNNIYYPFKNIYYLCKLLNLIKVINVENQKFNKKYSKTPIKYKIDARPHDFDILITLCSVEGDFIMGYQYVKEMCEFVQYYKTELIRAEMKPIDIDNIHHDFKIYFGFDEK